MGGLTVLAALRRELPDESFVYLGDTARLPYGTKSPSTVRRYAQQAALSLLEHDVKALVVACNTASGIALADLAERFAPVPVFGVVEPGARAAAAAARGGSVFVAATESTIAGGAYQRALSQADARVSVYGRACPLWVTLAEQGIAADPALTRAVLESGLRGMRASGARTLLLGCTHFPVFAESLAEILGPDVTIVDSAATTANAVASRLAELALVRRGEGDVEAKTIFCATDGVERFRRVGRDFLGASISEVELVDL